MGPHRGHVTPKRHHHLRDHWRDSHADDDAVPACHAAADRRRSGRRGGGGRRDHPPARARSARRPADSRAGAVHGVPAGHQAPVRCRSRHHDWRRPEHDGEGPSRRGSRLRSRDVLPEHGLDELRPVPDALTPQDLHYDWEQPYLEGSRDYIFRNTFADIETSCRRSASAPASSSSATTSAISTTSRTCSTAAWCARRCSCR